MGREKYLRVQLVQHPHFTIKETDAAKGQITCPTSGNSRSWNSQSSWLLGQGSSQESMPVISQSEIAVCLTQKELLFFIPQTPNLLQSCSLVILQSLAKSTLKWTLKNSPSNYFSNLSIMTIMIMMMIIKLHTWIAFIMCQELIQTFYTS